MQNDTDVKKMHWLMTGANHGTINTCGENMSLHCDESYYFDSLPRGSKDRLMDANQLIHLQNWPN